MPSHRVLVVIEHHCPQPDCELVPVRQQIDEPLQVRPLEQMAVAGTRPASLVRRGATCAGIVWRGFRPVVLLLDAPLLDLWRGFLCIGGDSFWLHPKVAEVSRSAGGIPERWRR